MFENVEYHLITVSDVDDDMLEVFTDNISTESYNHAIFIPYQIDRDEHKISFVGFSDVSQITPMFCDIPSCAQVIFCQHDGIEITGITFAEIERDKPELAAVILALLRRPGLRCDDMHTMWTLCNEEKAISDIKNMVGSGNFVDVISKMNRCIAKSKAKRLCCNVAFVNETGLPIGEFINALYKFYYAKGLVVDPFIATGDLSDAAITKRNTPFLYNICEYFHEDGPCLVENASSYAETFQKLCARKTLYTVELKKEEYEQLGGNASFKRLFPFVVHVLEPDRQEKLLVLEKEAQFYGFELSKEFSEGKLINKPLETIRSALMQAVMEKLAGDECDYLLSPADFIVTNDESKPRVSSIEELESLIGLKEVKKTVREIAAFVKNRGKNSGACLHMAFRGNPGTGKTTVARIIGRIFADIGVISDPDRFVEADRNKLVSKYLGGTAARTTEVVHSALGGVLFIDEAYSLFSDEKYDYGTEAVAALVKLMEDHRRHFVCIMAGYTEEMDKMLDMNPGLRSRIQFYIDFPDYDSAEMMEILRAMCEEEHYTLCEEAASSLGLLFDDIVANKDRSFANGRTVRNIFEQLRFKQAQHEICDDEITRGDVLTVWDEIKAKRGKNLAAKIRRIGFKAAA